MPSFTLRSPGGGSALRDPGTDYDLRAGVGAAVGVTIAIPTATAQAVALAPTIITPIGVTIAVPTASASAAALAPAVHLGASAIIAIPTATAIADAFTPTIANKLPAPVALATAQAFAPTLANKLQAPIAVATARANAPALGPDVFIDVPAPPTDWRIELWPINGASPLFVASAGASPITRWSFGYYLNGAGSFEATIPLDNVNATESNFEPGQREVKIFRNNVLAWGGYLWGVSVDIRGKSVTARGEGWISRLRKRFVMNDLILTNTNQEDIVWKLIQQTQTYGDLGFTRGTHTGISVQRDRDYCAAQHPNIGDSLDEFTQMDDGLDIVIAPDKTVNTYCPRKGRTPAVTLDGSNSMTNSYDIDATDVADEIITIGSADCNPPTDDSSSAGAIANFGLLQDVLSVDFGNITDVASHGREELRNRKQARWQADIEFYEKKGPRWGAFDIGDVIMMSAANGFATFTQQHMRVIGYDVAVEADKSSFTTVHLDSVIA